MSSDRENLKLLFNVKTSSDQRNLCFSILATSFLEELEKIFCKVEAVNVFPSEYINNTNDFKIKRYSLNTAVKIAFKKAFYRELSGYELDRYLKHYFLSYNGCFYELAKWFLIILDHNATIGSYRIGSLYYKDFPHYYEQEESFKSYSGKSVDADLVGGDK